jgi:hypothetical protein
MQSGAAVPALSLFAALAQLACRKKAKDDRFVIAVLGDGLCICSLLSELGGV